jgi:hypothetical protein
MVRQCPFCWDLNTQKVAKVPLDGTGRTRVLLECPDCEKWYWEDSAEEVGDLSGLCRNLNRELARCPEVGFQPGESGRFWSPKTKVREFNHICSECSRKRFSL